MTDFYTDLPDDGLGGPGKAFKYSKQLVIYLLLNKKIIYFIQVFTNFALI
jgi:hypothetical protein